MHALTDDFVAERVIREWITFYNTDRPHTALDKRTPDEAYFDVNLFGKVGQLHKKRDRCYLDSLYRYIIEFFETYTTTMPNTFCKKNKPIKHRMHAATGVIIHPNIILARTDQRIAAAP